MGGCKMEYLVKKGNEKENYGIVLNLNLDSDYAADSCVTKSCPRLGCCTKGGRALPITE